MNKAEKPSQPKFWTKDIVFLVLLNIVLLLVLFAGLIMVLGRFSPVIAAWLRHFFGL